MQLLRFSDSSWALVVPDPLKPLAISVPLTCRHSDRFRLFSVLTDSRSARPKDVNGRSMHKLVQSIAYTNRCKEFACNDTLTSQPYVTTTFFCYPPVTGQ